MSVHALLLLSCMHTLGLGLDLGNRLDQRERTRAHTRLAELPKIKRRLILNDTHQAMDGTTLEKAQSALGQLLFLKQFQSIPFLI